MRLLHASDLHIGLNRYGSTLADTERILAAIAESAVEHDVDIAVFSGDVFHVRRPGPAEILSFVSFVTRLTSGGITVVVGPGNHDGPGTINDPSGKSAAWMAAARMPGVHAFPEPFIGVVESTTGGPIAVASLPYPHKRSFDTSLPFGSQEQRMRAVGIESERFIRNAGSRIRKDMPSLFVGHLSVLGSKVGAEAAFAIGWDVTVEPDVFDEYDYAALGHIHKQQRISDVAWYAGSPDRQDFGEVTDKGWLIVEVEAGERPSITQVMTPGLRPFVTLGGDPDQWPDVDGAVVRLRCEQSDAAALGVLLRKRGAGWVKVEAAAPIAQERQERVTVTPETTVYDGLVRWLDTMGYPHEPYTSVALDVLADIDHIGDRDG